MKSLITYGLLFNLLVISSFSFAQITRTESHSAYHPVRNNSRATVADPLEDKYDVRYVKFNLALANDTTAISGDVTTRAVVTASSLAAYVFELNNSLTIDSILINGISTSFTTTGDVRKVNFATAMSAGTPFTAQVFYHGIPVTKASIFGGIGGINTAPDYFSRIKVTFTQSESYHASEWWPCKQSLRDKIDSVDMWLTVPDTLKAGSNGLLQAVTRVDPAHVRYEWKERYPIDYYLISLSVAPYIDYSYYMHFTSGGSDSMLVQNYIFPDDTADTYTKSVIDSTGLMIDYLSNLFGRYPFWHEKYGHCLAPLGGGMEHQTMTTIGYFSPTIVAHELGHQWFGDNATCGTWADIAMNEGFASYVEYLYLDHFNSHQQAINDMRRRQDTITAHPNGSVFCTDTTDENKVFDSRLSYDKGAAFLHMLRFVINNDSEFFYLFQAYQQEKRHNTGTFADFKTEATSIFGLSVNGIYFDSFFNQWVYGEGHPLYKVSWNQVGNDVYVKMDQTTSDPSSVSLFTMPIEIRLHSSAKDTVIRVLNDRQSQLFHFTWSRKMLSTIIDPNFWLVYKLNGNTHDTTLSNVSVPLITEHSIVIVPNPSSNYWTAKNLPDNTMLSLTDISGRILWQGSNFQNTDIVIPAEQLAKGLYVLRAIFDGKEVSNYKLIKE